MAEKWIQKAHLDKGAFTAKAKAAGKGVQEYAAEVTAEGSKASSKTKKQAHLAQTFAKMHRAEDGIVVVGGRALIDEAYKNGYTWSS